MKDFSKPNLVLLFSSAIWFSAINAAASQSNAGIQESMSTPAWPLLSEFLHLSPINQHVLEQLIHHCQPMSFIFI